MSAIHETKSIQTSDGLALNVHVWRVPQPTAEILISHGHGEHAGRYAHVATHLNAQGWNVIAPDHRGHGKSEGVRGHTPTWSQYVADLHQVATTLASPLIPRALIGHSMGGLIAVSYALEHGDTLRALVLSGPLLGLAFKVPTVKAIAGRVLSALLPSFTLPTGLDSKAISRDATVVAAYESDPLVHDKASARWFTEMLKALEEAHARGSSLRMPVLLFHGGADRLTDIEGSRRFFARLTAAARHFKEWPGLYHEILNEPEKERVLDEMTAWLRPHLQM